MLQIVGQAFSLPRASAQCHLVFAKAIFCTNCGADPLVRAGPPGPALLSKNQPSASTSRPTGGSAPQLCSYPKTGKTKWHWASARSRIESKKLGCGNALLDHAGFPSQPSSSLPDRRASVCHFPLAQQPPAEPGVSSSSTLGKGFVCIDRLLDEERAGPVCLRKGAPADYGLHAWVVKPNHVHMPSRAG